MNNNITEDYCSFEVAKLLKEKGFNIKCKYFFNEGSGWNRQSDSLLRIYENLIEHPTHALAIKWIRENFGISISANREAYYQEVYNKYVYSITWPLGAERKPVASPYFEKSEEAIEAALLHTLKNLIP